jgi:branched-chain amino acid transport system permease protein
VLNLDPVQSRIVYGVCLIAVIMLLPDGLIGGVVRALRSMFAGKPKRETEERDAAEARR